MSKQKIAIIGCGNLGIALAKGLLDNPTIAPSQIIATRRNISKLEVLAQNGIHTTNDNVEAARLAQILLIAVKPYNVERILQEIDHELISGKHTLVSVATGITLKQINAATSKPITAFRAMPNTAADVSESITCICHQGAKPDEIEQVESLFQSIGATTFIDEELMEAATVLGACGIAYVMRFIRAMIQGGIQIGFDAHTANKIVSQTVKGAAELLITRNHHPEQEIDKVTTPRGCTIEGLNEMEHHGFSSSLIKGIVSSYRKIEK